MSAGSPVPGSSKDCESNSNTVPHIVQQNNSNTSPQPGTSNHSGKNLESATESTGKIAYDLCLESHAKIL